MQNVVLVVHLILALCLIGIVLMQRSEGGGLGMGGGSGVMSGRGVTSALGKLTWAFAAAFIATSIALTVIAARDSADSSVLDQIGVPTAPSAPVAPGLNESDLLPPAPTADPLAPPRAD